MNEYYTYVIRSIIQDMKTTQTQVNTKWNQIPEHIRFNQKKTQVKDLIIEKSSGKYPGYFLDRNEYMGAVLAYDRLLSRVEFGDCFEKRFGKVFPIRTRVKMPDSVMQKLMNYTSGKENGKIPVNKCLNDLYGVRIILPDGDYEDVVRCLSGVYKTDNGVRVVNSCHGDYKAVHVYVKEDNFSFQWELQIWLEEFERANMISHSIHKQAYTEWEYAFVEEKNQ